MTMSAPRRRSRKKAAPSPFSEAPCLHRLQGHLPILPMLATIEQVPNETEILMFFVLGVKA